MGAKTTIAWCNATWNFLRGCSLRVEEINGQKLLSEACRNCYAKRVAASPRLSGPGKPYEGLAIIQNHTPMWTGEVRYIEKHLLDPVRWKDPKYIFVNSMSDLFHEKVDFSIIDEAVYIMQKANWHEYMALTKRVGRMVEYYNSSPERKSLMQRNKHIHWGCSIENQQMADIRMDLMAQLDVPSRWVSMEPMLEKINMARWLPHDFSFDPLHPGSCELCRMPRLGEMHDVVGYKAMPIVNWIAVGGESGPAAQIRSTPLDAFRDMRDQCKRAGIPFFMKQLGQKDYPGIYEIITAFPEDLQIREMPGFRSTSGSIADNPTLPL